MNTAQFLEKAKLVDKDIHSFKDYENLKFVVYTKTGNWYEEINSATGSTMQKVLDKKALENQDIVFIEGGKYKKFVLFEKAKVCDKPAVKISIIMLHGHTKEFNHSINIQPNVPGSPDRDFYLLTPSREICWFSKLNNPSLDQVVFTQEDIGKSISQAKDVRDAILRLMDLVKNAQDISLRQENYENYASYEKIKNEVRDYGMGLLAPSTIKLLEKLGFNLTPKTTQARKSAAIDVFLRTFGFTQECSAIAEDPKRAEYQIFYDFLIRQISPKDKEVNTSLIPGVEEMEECLKYSTREQQTTFYIEWGIKKLEDKVLLVSKKVDETPQNWTYNPRGLNQQITYSVTELQLHPLAVRNYQVEKKVYDVDDDVVKINQTTNNFYRNTFSGIIDYNLYDCESRRKFIRFIYDNVDSLAQFGNLKYTLKDFCDTFSFKLVDQFPNFATGVVSFFAQCLTKTHIFDSTFEYIYKNTKNKIASTDTQLLAISRFYEMASHRYETIFDAESLTTETFQIKLPFNKNSQPWKQVYMSKYFYFYCLDLIKKQQDYSEDPLIDLMSHFTKGTQKEFVAFLKQNNKSLFNKNVLTKLKNILKDINLRDLVRVGKIALQKIHRDQEILWYSSTRIDTLGEAFKVILTVPKEFLMAISGNNLYQDYVYSLRELLIECGERYSNTNPLLADYIKSFPQNYKDWNIQNVSYLLSLPVPNLDGVSLRVDPSHYQMWLSNKYPRARNKQEQYGSMIRIMHDYMIELVNNTREIELASRERARDARVAKQQEEYTKYSKFLNTTFGYEDEDCAIFAPTELRDLSREGSDMHNCVGGFIDAVARKETSIFYLRKQSDKEHSYITIELRKEPKDDKWNIRQCFGYANSTPKPEVIEWLYKWQKKCPLINRDSIKKDYSPRGAF